LTPERWAQIEELFHNAANCDPAVRTGLLDNACVNDPALRKEVEALLARDGGGAAAAVEASVRTELQNLIFPLTGKTVSHYQILNGLGGGGMGLVYRAQDIKLQRRVALKFLPEESAKDPDALRRFEREARSASALEHPNICPIYEFGEHEGQPFIVMPLLEGQTVEQFIHAQGAPKGPQQIQKVLELASQVLKGLETAHEHGIIHRDIKPGNIFLTTDGQAKILDFGVAKLTHAEIEDDDHRGTDAAETTTLVKGVDPTLSRTGAVFGTAAYMSPEQVRGERVDACTDIFSFGLVLYEMATGKRAFGGNTWPVLQEAVLRATPKPVRGSNPEIPARLESIINKALEKDRAARYQTASEMLADLEELQRQFLPKRLPRAWAAVLGIAAAILIATFAVVLMKKPKTISTAPEIKLRQLTINSSENPVIGGAISPDGKYLAYTDTRGMHIKVIATDETRTVPQPEALKDQRVKWDTEVWFPDSTRFLVNAYPSTEEWGNWSSVNASIWAVSVGGGAPTKVRDHAVAWYVSPDGSSVSFGTNKGRLGEREVWLMGPNGEQARKLYEVNEDSAICCFGWSRDAKQYTYVLTNSAGDAMLSRDTRGGPPVALLQVAETTAIKDFVWLHDGRLVYSLIEPGNGSVCNYWTMRLDLATGKHLEDARRLTNWPSFCASNSSVTNDDKRLAFTGFSSFFTSYVAELEAGGTRLRNTQHFTLEDSDDAAHGWTADGKLLVAQHREDGWGLYRQSLESHTPEPIVSSVAGGVLLSGATTPNGKWYIGRIWPDAENVQRPTIPLPIVRIPFAGGTPETILQLSRHGNVSCARPPSNRCVIAEQSEDRKQMIVSIFDALKGRGPELARFDFARELETLEVPTCIISPDGTRLAVARSPESPIEVYSLHGQLMRRIPSQSVGELIWLAWSANQKGLFVTRKAQRGNELLYLDVQGNVTSLRKCIGNETCFGFPSPDGRHLAVIDRNQSNNMWMMENF